MWPVIKNYFFPLFKKKTALLLVLFFVALGLFSPLYHAQAFLGPLAWLFMGAIAWMIAAFILSLTSIILWFAGVILSWSIDPWFIRVPYTSGGIVDIGWPIVRDLANMFIVLVLVIIGLATALRLEEYRAKKTLPLLIVVALLINFTPVILGVIVDFTNIVMNFFLAEVTGGEALFQRFQALGSMISSNLGGLKALNPLTHWSLFFQIMIVAIFNVFAAIVFFLFAFLFVMRRIVIWMLVIVSPIAFVAYVLPATRSFSRWWWHQFIQWSIIGVFAAFFLYLGEQMIMIASGGGFIAATPGGGVGGFLEEHVINVFNQVLPYGIALIFLLIGFFAALNTSAMGASGVIRGTQGLTRRGAAWMGRQARARAAAWGRERVLRSPRIQRWGKRLAKAGAPTWGEGKKGLMAWAQRRGATVAVPLWTGAREAGRTVTTRVQEAELAEIRRLKEEAKRKWTTPDSRHAALVAAGTPAERIAIIEATKEEGRLRHLRRSMLSYAHGRGLSEEEAKEEYQERITKIGNESLKIHPDAFKQIRTAYPHLIEKAREGIPQEVQDRARISDREAHAEGYATVVRKVLGEMTTEEASRMDPGAHMNEKVKEAIHELWDGPKIAAAGRTIGKAFVDSFNEEMERRGSQWYWDDEKKTGHNRKIWKYTSRTTAQELGFRPPPGAGTETVPGPPKVPPPPPPGAPPPPPEEERRRKREREWRAPRERPPRPERRGREREWRG